MTYLSIIIPVYNEQKRLQGLNKVLKFLNKQSFPTEMIIVNDGSTDDTLKLIKEFQNNIPTSDLLKLKIVSYLKNKGKGYAIKRGISIATGKHHLFLDVDLSTPISEFGKLLPHLDKFDILIGSRKMPGAKLRQRQPFVRETMGKVFTLISQLVLGVWISDFTCGFKCFSKRSSKKIFSKTLIDRWGFDSEVLFLAKQFGHSIKEIPISWKNDTNTKVKFPDDIINSLKELTQIRRNHFFGRYR